MTQPPFAPRLAGRPSRRPGRYRILALALAAALAAGMAAAAPLVAAPAAAAPAAAAPAAPAAHGAVPGAGTGICGKTASGRMSDCPKPLANSALPAGARDSATMGQAPADLASLVDTRTWTSGGGNTFPGADVPFGMVQWSPDTSPDRSDGGGYDYGDTSLIGYSLTHLSGPGCAAGGDVPILPLTGTLPSGAPNTVMSSFTNTGEVAQAGYYSAQSNMPSTITSQFTATPHTSMGRFTFPETTSADFLIKLADSESANFADSAQIVGDNEVAGADTSGDFCGETNNAGQVQQYTVYFDLVFSQPFTASQVITQAGQTDPAGVFLTFNTMSDPVISAKVAISYVSTANAQLDLRTENPGWDFDAVKAAAQASWNRLLGKIRVSGGSYAQTQEFYSLLYKDFLQPNITSDVNGQYMGADMQVHSLSRGQRNQYGIYSGWDIYHSLAELQAMLDPQAASDQAQSLVNYYSQDQILQQWGYLNLNNYVMVGDPAQSIISDYYAFGARDFNTRQALTDMLTQATTVNDVRPGEALEQQYGYLPADGSYGCCNAHGVVATLLEYDTADLALSQFAASMGDVKDASMLQQRANNWENMFDPGNGLLTARYENGQFVPGIVPLSEQGGEPYYVEGDAYEYLWDVPNDYSTLFTLLGGDSQVVPALTQYLSQPNGFGMYGEISNEFDLGEQYALDYAGDPAGTQLAVSTIENTVFLPGPTGLDNNDDLGAESSQFIWEMLGLYPENPGSDNLLLSSPGFPYAAIRLADGRTITINAPGASPTEFYARSLTVNGQPDSRLYLSYSQLSRGATLDWALGTSPTSWGSAPQDAPPSYTAGVRPVVGFASPEQMLVAPGGSATETIGVQDAVGRPQVVTASVSAPAGLTVTPGSGSIPVPADGRGSLTLNVSAGAGLANAQYPVTVTFSERGRVIGTAAFPVVVETPGDLAPFVNNVGVTDDSATTPGNFDGNGNSYSAQALADAGITPGGAVTSDGVTFIWPDAAAGSDDNVITNGQTVSVSGSGPTLGFLGTAVNGVFTGGGTIYYTDGSTQSYTISYVNWTSGSPPAGDTLIAKTPYLNTPTGQLTRERYLYGAFVPLEAGKTVAAVQLPEAAGSGDTGIHIFAIAVG
jgi:predicted alpha-1,2-mannosidase